MDKIINIHVTEDKEHLFIIEKDGSMKIWEIYKIIESYFNSIY